MMADAVGAAMLPPETKVPVKRDGVSSVKSYMGAEKSGEPCTVPNVVGLSASEANKAITNAGLIMKSTGASADPASSSSYWGAMPR